MGHRTGHGSLRLGANQACPQDAGFERYVVPEIPALRRRARRLTGASHDADDLVQETLIRANRAVMRFDGRYPRAWLFAIMRNAWLNESRKRRPVPVLDPEDVAPGRRPEASTWGDPEDALSRTLLDPVLAAGLERLPHTQQVVIRAVTMEGLSCRQVAVALAIPVGTVLSRLHRARAGLRKELCRSLPTRLAGGDAPRGPRPAPPTKDTTRRAA